MIYTVFPNDENIMPQDFPTEQEAEEFGDSVLNGEYEIEITDGECVWR